MYLFRKGPVFRFVRILNVGVEKNKLGAISDCVKGAACFAQNIFIAYNKLTIINVYFALSCFCTAGYSVSSVWELFSYSWMSGWCLTRARVSFNLSKPQQQLVHLQLWQTDRFINLFVFMFVCPSLFLIIKIPLQCFVSVFAYWMC